VEALLAHHSPIAIDVFARYHIDPREIRPLNERIVIDKKNEEFACAFCGAPMSIRKTKDGAKPLRPVSRVYPHGGVPVPGKRVGAYSSVPLLRSS
jgi:hypothetical protein